ncbi:MAG: 30S ribosomal protein S16 [Minisyncoccia bacterium]
MLIIRLQRVGRVHEPTFRIVLTDSKNSTKSGRYLEVLGSYDARGKGICTVDGEKVKHWISKGVQLSATVRNFLIEQKIIAGKKINVLPKNKIINANKAKEAEEAAKNTPKAEVKAEKPVEEVKVETPKEEVKA